MKNPAKIIINALGEEKLMAELGFTQRNIRHARTSGKFAGAWFDEIEALCHKNNVYCPRSAFAWKRPDQKVGNDNSQLQEVARNVAQENGQSAEGAV